MSDRDKFSRGVWWNVGALAVAGAAGILLNFLVSAVHGVTALGVFNQVFAAYILFSQLGALGVHYSALTNVAAADEGIERQAMASSALLASAATGLLFAAAAWLLSGPIGRLLGSPDVAHGIRCVAPGILFFSLSKVTLSCLNALRRMRWYAVLYGGRFVLMLVAFAGFSVAGVDAAGLPGIISLAEGIIFLTSLLPLAGHLRPVRLAEMVRRARAHLLFGLRGFSSGLVSELNTRIDVLLLGYFAGDAVVGAYSFAAILAEGLYQLLIVLRTNYAPIIIRMWADGSTADLTDLVRRVRDRTYLGALATGGLAVAGYVLLVPLLTSDPALAASWPYFAILLAGMAASAGYAPFQPLLLYAGLPGWHSLLTLGTLACNAIGNILLIPIAGATGAAFATAVSFLLGVILLRMTSARLLSLRI